MQSYQILKTTPLNELKATLTELIHTKSGAHVMHIANDDPENLFCLSFRTTPDSSNGVAHILEHTVLCGSKKYPIKDPFFSMTRRSLNTFMNAMTGSDFTCYPAATQIEKDFYNLLDVYLDAVFYPTLNPLSFLQEGVRLEFKEPKNSESPLEYKGIVFNEMKGSLASGSARLAELMNHSLFPSTTYGVNSGGDPKEIPHLSYTQLKAFHEKYYHPSQCLFFFYGDLPIEKHLAFIDEKVLSHTISRPPLPDVARQPRFKEPKYVEGTYPIAHDASMEDKALISFGWVTTDIKDTLDTLALTTLVLVLMDNDASLLKQPLLKSGLCKQATAYLDNEMAEVPFILTLRGCEKESADAIEKIIFESLSNLVKEGIPVERINSVIHQLELSRCEITGDSHPFGLSLFMRSALLKHHGVEPEEGLLIHSVFDKLRDKIVNDTHYFSEILEKYLVNNTHRVRIIMTPSTSMAQQEIDEETETLEEVKKELDQAARDHIIRETETLNAFQNSQEEQDIDVLPQVTLKDVPLETKDFPIEKTLLGAHTLYTHPCFTNGLVYADLVFDLPQLEEKDLPYMRLLSTVMTQTGAGGKNYVETLEAIQENTGGIGTALAFNVQADNENHFLPSLHIKGKALYTKKEALFQLLYDMTSELDWKDTARFKEILDKHYTGLTGSLQQNALRYAMSLSASPLSAASRLANIWFGLDYYEFISKIKDSPEETLQILKRLFEKCLRFAPLSIVVSADNGFIQEAINHNFWALSHIKAGSQEAQPWALSPATLAPQGRMIASHVAFTAKTFKTVPFVHPNAPALAVLSHLFDNLTLHAKIREQGGAYGGGATANSSAAQFTFYGYRDPHIASTLHAFKESIDHVIKGEFDEDDLEEAKLEIVQGLDSPVSPGSRADVGYGWLREGKTPEMRQAYRERMLSLTKEDIIRAAQDHIVHQFDLGIPVVFAGKELLVRENEKLSVPLELLSIV